MTASHIAVAILSDLWYSFCEPLGSLLYIMFFSTTISFYKSPDGLAIAYLLLRTWLYAIFLVCVTYCTLSSLQIIFRINLDGISLVCIIIWLCVYTLTQKRSRQLGMGKRVGGQFFRMFRIRKLLTCYKSVAKIFLRFQGVSQRRLFPLAKWKCSLNFFV